MNERLAFFCNRDTASCHLYTWTHTDGGGETLYQVYCRGALHRAATDALAIEIETIRPWIDAADGGLIAETRLVGAALQLRVETIPAPGYDPATELLVLRPGQEPARQPLGPDPLDLAPGAFVLLPATRADQSNLAALVEHLDRLPGDYRALLLNVLRRPGIEGALWRLEGRLDRLTATGVDSGTEPQRTPPAPAAARWHWLLAGLLILNLLTTLAAAWWTKPSPDTPAPAPSDCGARRLPPAPDWSGCGPPWFCQTPLAPGWLKPRDGTWPRTLEIDTLKPKAK
ncbi:hypothetical protein [uncultured Thiodictyon sp.]|uniref:hypothetical protein n=1 Tax=uncultured Thiodictyon sp. TaxID=1846217 RepID=UPI0025CDD188|nr:hypothetical protein [uncultured Thiodictyon sp.]